MDKLVSNPHQPRKSFNQVELDELAVSLKEHGLLQPIVVKKIDNDKYYIIAGERRTKAAKLADLKEVPVIVLDIDDNKMKELALIENIQRVDLNIVEEAVAYKELGEVLNLTQEKLAKKIGKSRSHVTNILRLLTLPEEVLEMLSKKLLTMGQVKPLINADLKKADLIKVVNKIIEDKLTSRQVEEMIKEITKPATIKTSESSIDENTTKSNVVTAHLENQIIKKLGAKVKLDSKKIVIEYKGLHDLNRILAILNLLEK
ncbi:ParB/RepB/Spo0J family partition protein [Spiroplasma endosymbiont of Anurida maritima]|uniref:ParB/RepB/Spo0J family partition protein n=1 Tax=Spiroplasma endosymbiont of Anurida maritima TaxID=2967972 RepID=UPI0036D3E42A